MSSKPRRISLQVLRALHVLEENASLDTIPSEVWQWIKDNPQEAGERFKTFLEDVTKSIVDLDADPMVPNDWTVEEHINGGQFEFDSKRVILHLDEGQQDGGVVVGNELRKKLEGKNVYNANLLDFLLAHTDLIPEEWKGKTVFFWGTIYRRLDGYLYVRCLCWNDGRWRWNYNWLDGDFYGLYPAAVPASN